MEGEHTHSFDLADVGKYGSIEKALIIKEIRGIQLYKQRNGKPAWVYYSGSALAKKFPYMKRASINRWMKELVADGHLQATVNNKSSYDRTLSYRLPTLGISTPQNEQSTDHIEPSTAQSEATIPSLTTPLTSNSTHVELAKAEKPAYGKPEINELFDYWAVGVGYPIASRLQANRNACNNLLKRHGADAVRRFIDGVAIAQGTPYAPRIADFCGLQADLSKLLAWGKQKVSSHAIASF